MERNQSQGGLGVDARIADGQWQAHANLGLIYNSQRDQTADRRRVDMTSGLVEASRGPVAVRVGDHSIPGSSLVMDSFARRGVSGSVRVDGLRSNVTGFSMRTEAVNGFRNWPGASDGRHRTDGVTLTTAPLASNPERMQVSATYLNGEGSPVGSSQSGADEPVTTRAASLAADSLTWDGRVRLRGEYAYSRADLDASAGPLNAQSDDAWDLLAVYQHPQQEVRSAAFDWNIGAEHKRVGPWFLSLGNPALPADRLLNQAFGGFNWGGWSLNVQAARETDNVDDIPALTRMRTDHVTVGTSYTPAGAEEKTGVMRLFAQPTLTAYAQHAAQKFEHTPAGFGGDRVNDDTDSAYVGLHFTPGDWSWDIAHTRTWFNDAANVQVDYVDDLSELGFDVPLSQGISLSPTLQYERNNDHDNAVLTESLAAQAGFSVLALDDRLNAGLGYTMNRSWADNDPSRKTTYTFNAMASWALVQPRENRPGVSLFTTGSYSDDDNLYQIFAGVRIGWQAAY